MTALADIKREELLRALATAPDGDPVAEVCTSVFRAEPRAAFPAPLVPAREFAFTMRRKFVSARASGRRVIHGGDEFLAALAARGERSIVGVFTVTGSRFVQAIGLRDGHGR